MDRRVATMYPRPGRVEILDSTFRTFANLLWKPRPRSIETCSLC